MGKGVLQVASWMMAGVLLLTGCGGGLESNNKKGEAKKADKVSETTENSTNKTYTSNFKAQGEKADLYNQNLENFQQEFLEYYKGTNELDKVRGYQEPIEVNTINWYTAAVEEAMGNFGKKYGESINENRWTDALKRMYNIDVKYNWQAQDADYTQKLRLDMTSGELPDVFLVREQNDLIQMAEQGLIWDMTDIIDQYASDYDKQVWASDQNGAMTKATHEGNVYGVPSVQSATDAVPYIWIRDDWMQKLNLEYPKTLDELEKVMDAFVSEDPDGNGQDDTWGISMNNNIVESLRGIFAAFGSYPDDWYSKDDKLVNGMVADTTKEALEYIATLYKKKYLNPEFVAQDATKANEAVLNNQVGILFGGHWFGHTAGDLHEINPDAAWKCIKLPSHDGDPVKSILRPVAQGWIVVNKKFSHPEIALKMRTLTTYGLLCKESAWWWYEENISWNISPVRCNVSAFDNLNTYINLQEVFESKDETELKAKAVPYWDNLHGDQAWEWGLMFGPGENTPMAILRQDKDEGNLFWNPYNGVQSKFMQERWSNIMDERMRAYTDIVTGKTSVEEGYRKWLKTYETLGGDQIEKEVNAWYQENKTE
ncbi:hypothetical protein INP51_11855 [Blautia liquoris]|uniref:Lipoprotein LipO n=1 Tax=Blautia liquoris TaxID=2779518 RepID=A0A7M2RFE3_9FIRM|nr:hypothetical protein [Blautia liquoris]QOV18694.1 hypothetical protein INP51_11855 [Blautia liquoris]